MRCSHARKGVQYPETAYDLVLVSGKAVWDGLLPVKLIVEKKAKNVYQKVPAGTVMSPAIGVRVNVMAECMKCWDGKFGEEPTIGH